MQIRAQRPIFAAHAAKERAQLFIEGRLPRGDHFRHQQAGENAVFLRNMAANGEAGALFASERDGVFQNQLADVLEADRRLVNFAAVFGGDGVEQMRSGHAARGIQLPAAAFDEVVVKQAENVVGRNPGAVRVDDAEAVGVAIGGQADLRFMRGLLRDHGFREELQIALGDVRAGALEENIALGANGFAAGDAVFGEGAIEIAGAAAVQRVVDDARARFSFLIRRSARVRRVGQDTAERYPLARMLPHRAAKGKPRLFYRPCAHTGARRGPRYRGSLRAEPGRRRRRKTSGRDTPPDYGWR